MEEGQLLKLKGRGDIPERTSQMALWSSPVKRTSNLWPPNWKIINSCCNKTHVKKSQQINDNYNNNMDLMVIWDVYLIAQCFQLHNFHVRCHPQALFLLFCCFKNKSLLNSRCEGLRRWHFTNDSSKKLTKMDVVPLLTAPEKHSTFKMTSKQKQTAVEKSCLLCLQKECDFP